MKDLNVSKLSLKKEHVSELSSKEMADIKGGAFLSIGCSRRDSCTRARQKRKCKLCHAYR